MCLRACEMPPCKQFHKRKGFLRGLLFGFAIRGRAERCLGISALSAKLFHTSLNEFCMNAEGAQFVLSVCVTSLAPQSHHDFFFLQIGCRCKRSQQWLALDAAVALKQCGFGSSHL